MSASNSMLERISVRSGVDAVQAERTTRPSLLSTTLYPQRP